MSKILIDRAAMQKALEALEYENSWHKPRNEKPYASTLDAITALKAALAEPERKRRTVKKRLTDDGWKKTREYCS